MAGGSPRAGSTSGERHSRHIGRRINLSELGTGLVFVSLIAYFGYDGFKQIFTKPEPFKPKEAQESIAELKAAINKGLGHKYLPNQNPERRSALATDPPPLQEEIYVTEPVFQLEEEELPYTKVVVVSAMQEGQCLADGGDKLHYLSVLNKQDYARVNGYEFVLGIKQVDPQLENMWNKPAWINKVLEDEELAAEWLVWMDIDTVVIDANYTLPFEEFAAKSKDLVVYGNRTETEKGHPVKALNTGVMAIRNTPWARHFFKEVSRLGRLDDHHKGKNTLSKILLKELQADAYSDGLRDQNAVIYLLKTHPEWQDRVLFQDKEICLNCYWQDLIGVTGYGVPEYERKENVSFVQHFMGCQTCMALNRNGDLEKCQQGMFHSFKFTSAYHAPMLKDSRPRSEKDLKQLRELVFCSNNPRAYGCAGAQPLGKEQQEQYEREKHRPQYNWKAVDNATVSSSISSVGDAQVEKGLEDLSVRQAAGQAASDVSDLASKKVVNSKGHLEARQGHLDVKPTGGASAHQANDLRSGALSKPVDASRAVTETGHVSSGSGKSRASGGVTGSRTKGVERRRAAEGTRRQRHSRASSRRASHSLVRNQEYQNS